jgi:tRNA nucleotidyltransferase (CCA-adding enzyme)
MKCTKVQDTIQRSLSSIRAEFSFLPQVIAEIQAVKGTVFLVGGAVRDILLLQKPKDLDIEVHGLSLQQLETILKKYGPVRTVGKAFGVVRIDGVDIDWSIPRSDASGRHPHVTLNPHMSVAEACRRRDLTMNAMMINLATGELEDPFNGYEDMQKKILRAPDVQLFVEDPLRFYRVMQFIGRFEMMPDQELSNVGATMDISHVSKERIFQEFEKLFLKSKKPSLALQWLDTIGKLELLLPELYATKGIMQHAGYHPEGDVFEHTKQAVDGAAQGQYESDQERLIMVLAALCHDLGKVETTRMIDGILRSHGHDIAGVPLADQLLDRISHKTCLKKPILRLVRYHMMPVALVKNNAKAGAYKRLARNLCPVTLRQLYHLAIFDKSARNPERGAPLENCPEPLLDVFVDQAQKYGVLDAPEAPLLTGEDFAGIVPEGPQLGVLLQEAYDLQLEHGIQNKEELKQLVLKKLI